MVTKTKAKTRSSSTNGSKAHGKVKEAPEPAAKAPPLAPVTADMMVFTLSDSEPELVYIAATARDAKQFCRALKFAATREEFNGACLGSDVPGILRDAWAGRSREVTAEPYFQVVYDDGTLGPLLRETEARAFIRSFNDEGKRSSRSAEVRPVRVLTYDKSN